MQLNTNSSILSDVQLMNSNNVRQPTTRAGPILCDASKQLFPLTIIASDNSSVTVACVPQSLIEASLWQALWHDISLGRWLLLAATMVIFVIGLTGNTFVCLSVYRNTNLRNVTNYFIVNLAVADCLVILVCLPPSVIWDLTLTWWFGGALCKLVTYLQNVSVSVSVLTLTCIAVDRYYAICHPLARFKSTTRRVGKTIACLWLIACLVNGPDLVYLEASANSDLTNMFGFTTTLYTDCRPAMQLAYWAAYYALVAHFMCLYCVPLLFMLVAYYHINKVLSNPTTSLKVVSRRPVNHHRNHPLFASASAPASATPGLATPTTPASTVRANERATRIQRVLRSRFDWANNNSGKNKLTNKTTKPMDDIELTTTLVAMDSANHGKQYDNMQNVDAMEHQFRPHLNLSNVNHIVSDHYNVVVGNNSSNNDDNNNNNSNNNDVLSNDVTLLNNNNHGHSVSDRESHITNDASNNIIIDGLNSKPLSCSDNSQACCLIQGKDKRGDKQQQQQQQQETAATAMDNDLKVNYDLTLQTSACTINQSVGTRSTSTGPQQRHITLSSVKCDNNFNQTPASGVGVMFHAGNSSGRTCADTNTLATVTVQHLMVDDTENGINNNGNDVTSNNNELKRDDSTNSNNNNNEHVSEEVEEEEDDDSATTSGHISNEAEHRRRRKKAANMLMAIVCMFAVCFLPVHLNNILRCWPADLTDYLISLRLLRNIQLTDRDHFEIPQNEITNSLALVSHLFCYVNSAINPIIYNCMNREFRREFRRVLVSCAEGAHFCSLTGNPRRPVSYWNSNT